MTENVNLVTIHNLLNLCSSGFLNHTFAESILVAVNIILKKIDNEATRLLPTADLTLEIDGKTIPKYIFECSNTIRWCELQNSVRKIKRYSRKLQNIIIVKSALSADY